MSKARNLDLVRHSLDCLRLGFHRNRFSQELAHVSNFLTRALEKLEVGELVDLTGLPRAVALRRLGQYRYDSASITRHIHGGDYTSAKRLYSRILAALGDSSISIGMLEARIEAFDKPKTKPTGESEQKNAEETNDPGLEQLIEYLENRSNLPKAIRHELDGLKSEAATDREAAIMAVKAAVEETSRPPKQLRKLLEKL